MRVEQVTEKKGKLVDFPMLELFKISSMFPGWSGWKEGTLIFDLVGANIEFLSERYPDLVWNCDAKDRIQRAKEQREKTLEIKKDKAALSVIPDSFIFETQPFLHQLQAWNMSKDLKVFALFMEMGCGKSKVLIDTIAWLYQQGIIDTALIIAPNNVHIQWIDEQLPAHMPKHINYGASYYSSSSKAAKRKEFQDLLNEPAGQRLRVFSINIEYLSSDAGYRLAEKIIKTSKKPMLNLDESSRIKHISSKRTKKCLDLAELVEYKRILSGSPITRGIEDLYSQLSFLDKDILGFKTYTSFKSRYCLEEKRDQYSFVAGYINVDDLQQRLEGYSFRITKQECLDLPDKVYVRRSVDMTTEQKRVFDELKENLIAQLDNGDLIEVTVAITSLIKLQQISSGHIKMEDGSVRDIIPMNENPKLKAVAEIVDEAQGQIIIWARFIRDIELLKAFLIKEGHTVVTYYGGNTPEKNGQNREEFLSGRARIIVANQQSGGIGQNWTVANTTIYFSNSFDAELRWQSEDRNHRIGQANKVTYYDVLARSSIDQRILSRLSKKQSVSKMTLDEVRLLLKAEEEGFTSSKE